MPDMKKGHLAMLLLGKPADKAEPEEDKGTDHKAAGKQAMQEWQEAAKRGDSEAMFAAFESAFQICEMAPHDEAGDDDEGD